MNIVTQRLASGTLFFLPLCPSTNRRTRPVRMGGVCREILTKEARDYIEGVGLSLKWWARAAKFPPVATYSFVDLWFVLPRVTADATNYQKVLLDTLQAGGLLADDRYALTRIMGVSHDAQRPEVVVKI